MKQSHIALVIVLLSLITLIVAASIALLVITNSTGDSAQTSANSAESSASVTIGKNDEKTTPSLTTAPVIPPVTTTQAPPATTTPSAPVTDPPQPPTTTTIPVTDAPIPPSTTTIPVTDAPMPPPTTTAPITDEPQPPVTTAPEQPKPSPSGGTIDGDKVGSLRIHADYTVIDSLPDSSAVRVRFTVYIYSYSLQLSPRTDNYLVINGEKLTGIETAAINLPTGSPKTRTVLYETVLELAKPTETATVPLEVEFHWHFKGSYSGESAEWVSVKASLNISP